MQIIYPVVAKMPKGGYKVIIWGQHDGHMMDWNGCNYRYIVPKGQPRNGFPCADGAALWWSAATPDFRQDELDRASQATGSHLGYGGPAMVGNRLQVVDLQEAESVTIMPEETFLNLFGGEPQS